MHTESEVLRRRNRDSVLAKRGPASTAGGPGAESWLSPLIWILAVLTLCLWVYIFSRAVDLAFTTDESVSYGFSHGLTALSDTANNQWLNTLLMGASQSLFGQAEWALRLPNVLAFLVYGTACMAFVGMLRSTAARLVCFALLMGDPFLLEFFGLARGYGLSLAFSAAALAVLLGYPLRGSGRRAVLRLVAVGVLGAAGFYANFSALNFLLALLGGIALDTVIRYSLTGLAISGREWLAMGMVGAAILAGLIPGVVQVEHLNKIHQLYFGGHTGFVQDTIGTLVETWAYVRSVSGGLEAVSWTLAILGLGGVAYAGWRLARTRCWERLQLAAVVLVISVAAVVVERWALGTLYPINRTALTYILAYAALLVLVIDDMARRLGPAQIRWALAFCCAGLFVLAAVNLFRTANLTSTYDWPFDASSRAVTYRLMDLERRYGGTGFRTRLVVVWPTEYAFIYYKMRFGLGWLQIVPIHASPDGSSVRFPPGRYLYDVPPNVQALIPSGARKVATLRPDQTQLWIRTAPVSTHKP